MGYEWDVFVSYPRRDPIGPWVHDRFLPLLQRWLNAALPGLPRIFVDDQMEGGVHWPSRLSDALHRSRYMVAVLAPPYFGSGWCMSEWQTMKAREKALGLGQGGAPGLVRAIRFFDGDTFPADVRAVQADDFTGYNMLPPGKAPLKTRPYRELEQKIQALCQDVASRIAAAPPWDATWPVMRSPDPAFDTSLSFSHVALTRDAP